MHKASTTHPEHLVRFSPIPSRQRLLARRRVPSSGGSAGEDTHSPSVRARPSPQDDAKVERPRDDIEASTSDGPNPDNDPKTPSLVALLRSLVRMARASFGKLVYTLVWPLRKLSSVYPAGVGRLVLIFFALILAQNWLGGSRANTAAVVPYSSFVAMARQGQIQAAHVDEPSHTLQFYVDLEQIKRKASAEQHRRRWFGRSPEPEAPATTTPQYKAYATRLVEKDTSYITHLIDNGVTFGVKKQTLTDSLGRLTGTLLGLWIPLIPLLFLFKRMFDAQLGKNEKTKPAFSPPDTTFKDVAGVDGVKVELEEAIQCLRNPQKFEKLNARMPSGVLLCGPPGTGKTLLARAVAGEAGVPFFAVSASEFVEMFVGRGAARIRELFAQARKASPSVVFIDELDAVGGRRGAGVNDERDQTLNQLLTELDGFEGRPGVLLLAATNRPQVLDPALLRPGRISRRIVVPLPDLQGRKDILAVHLRNIPMESEELKAQAVEYVATMTNGFSGAELFNAVNEGALLAARRNVEFVNITDLVSGVGRTKYGVNSQAPWLTQLSSNLRKLFPNKDPAVPKASALL